MTLEELKDEILELKIFDHLNELNKSFLLYISVHTLVIFLSNHKISKDRIDKEMFIEIFKNLPFKSDETDFDRIYKIFLKRDELGSVAIIRHHYEKSSYLQEEILVSIDAVHFVFRNQFIQKRKISRK